MKTRQRSFPNSAEAMLLVGAVLLLVAGCGGAEELNGRVAIDVTVQVGGETPESGTLVLKPQRGVRSPLIRISIEDGVGSAPAEKGPVPGGYSASFRSGTTSGDIDDQLTRTGREMPSARARVSAASSRQTDRSALTPRSDVSVSVPDENPATLLVSFDAA
ncbi:MAG: hypothetical protein P8K08_10780 [Fuerstiella sp.]|nr:hypothetical protein [Fuerstiella sp.]